MLGEEKYSEEQNKMINGIVYSYKNPKVKEHIEHNMSVSGNELHITLIDQHPLNRIAKFDQLYNFVYQHVFWDKINSPCLRKCSVLFDEDLNSDYTLLISDDITLSDGWLETAKEFLDNNSDAVISGFGSGSIKIKEKYFLEKEHASSDSFLSTNYIDSKFLFGKTKDIKTLDYPVAVKYHGESEMLSWWAYQKGIKVFSAPSTMLQEDTKLRTLENLYTPFSIEHNYNQSINLIKKSSPEWFELNNIDIEDLKEIPYQIDDVLYDPYEMKMLDVNQERFIGRVKAIY